MYYRDGDLELSGNITIVGTLVVKQDLILKSNCNLTVTSVKNFPALIVGNDVTMEAANQSLTIYGLAQISNSIDMKNKTGCSINVMGALYITGSSLLNLVAGTVNITALHDRASIETWPTVDTAVRWTPTAGAFFRSIQRK